VGDFFGNPKTYAGYLCTVRTAERRPCSAYEAEAATLFEEQRDLQLRSLLRSEEDLMTFLEFLLKKIVFPEGEAARARQIADRKRIDRLQEELGRVRKDLAAAGDPPPESLAADRERIEAEIGAIMKWYHEGGAVAWRTKSRIQVIGGISLRPDEFTISKNPASPALQKFKLRAQGAAVAAGPGGGSGRLVRSRPTGKIPPVAGTGTSAGSALSVAPPRPAPPAASPAHPAATATRSPQGNAAAAPAGKAAPPSVAKAGPERVPGLITARVAIPAGAAGATRALGELAADGRIVFRRVPP